MSQADNPKNRRLEQLLAEIVRAVETGQLVDREALLTAHPDLADDLRSYFQNRDALIRLAAPLVATGDSQTVTQHIGATASIHQRHRVRYFGDYELLEEIARGGMGVVLQVASGHAEPRCCAKDDPRWNVGY